MESLSLGQTVLLVKTVLEECGVVISRRKVTRRDVSHREWPPKIPAHSVDSLLLTICVLPVGLTREFKLRHYGFQSLGSYRGTASAKRSRAAGIILESPASAAGRSFL